MIHPDLLLADYALGLLEPEERAEVEAHLAECPACRVELRRYRDSVVGLVEALPETAAPAGVWERIEAELEPRRPAVEAAGGGRPAGWRAWAAAAALVLVLGGAWWGVGEYRLNAELRAEQRRVARWLSQPQVEMQALESRAGERLGGVLLLPDGRALFVLAETPEPGRAYQAWGHRGDDLVSLGVSGRPVFEVPWQGFDTLYLSLEPRSGSPEPTEPMGRVDF